MKRMQSINRNISDLLSYKPILYIIECRGKNSEICQRISLVEIKLAALADESIKLITSLL